MTDKQKHAAAVELGRRGGIATAKKLTKAERLASSRKAWKASAKARKQKAELKVKP